MPNKTEEYLRNHVGSILLFATQRHASLQAALNFLEREDLKGEIYANRSRVKDEERLIEKIEQKRSEKKTYDEFSPTDVIGVRIVTLFVADMIKAVSEIVRLINHTGSIAPSPFLKGHIEECRIFSSGQRRERTAIQGRVRQILRHEGVESVELQTEEPESGYSSVHIVSRLEHDPIPTLPEAVRNQYRIPVEIQVRTVFEDAWGEIDHKLRYGEERNLAMLGNSRSSQIGEHLLTLKTFCNGASQYAELIRHERKGSEGLGLAQAGRVAPVDSGEDPILALQRVGVGPETLQAIKIANDMQDNAKKIVDAKDIPAKEKQGAYLDAANGYQEVLDSCESGELEGHLPREARTALLVFLKGELAYCLLNSGRSADLDSAVNMYIELEELAPFDAVLRFRKGQALARLGEPDAAIEAYLSSQTLLEKQEGQDEISDAEGRYLRQTIPRFIGYQYWRLAEHASAGDGERARIQQLFHLRDAYEWTKKAFLAAEDTSTKQRALNNLVYYEVECLDLLKSLPIEAKPSEFSLDENVFKKDFDEFIRNLDVSESKDWKQLDTVACAYLHLNEPAHAVEIAQQIRELLWPRASANDQPADVAKDPAAAKRRFRNAMESLSPEARIVIDRALWIIHTYSEPTATSEV